MGAATSKENTMYPDATFTNHKSDILCMDLSADGSMMATGSDDFSIRTWSIDGEIEECTGLMIGHTGYITCLRVHDAYLMSGSDDMTLRRWDLLTCECQMVFEGHTGRVLRMICSAEYMFSSSLDNTAKAWLFTAKDPSHALMKSFEGHTKCILSLIFLPELDSDGTDKEGVGADDVLITGSADGTAMSWSLETGAMKQEFYGHRAGIQSMVTGKDKVVLFTGSNDKTIRIWRLATGHCLKVLEGHRGPVLCMQLVGGFLYSGDGSGEAQCRFKKSGSLTQTYTGHQHSVVALKFEGGLLYTVSSDTCARAFDVSTGDMKYIFRGHTKCINDLRIIGQNMFTVSSDATLRKWKLSKPKPEDAAVMQEDDDDDDLLPQILVS